MTSRQLKEEKAARSRGKECRVEVAVGWASRLDLGEASSGAGSKLSDRPEWAGQIRAGEREGGGRRGG